MKELARLSLRGRRGQVAALAATVLFSAAVLGVLIVLFETGVRGRVATGEYGSPPVLIAARQSLPVAGDVDVAVPGRALLPETVVEAAERAAPRGRVVVDRIVPAVVAHPGDDRPILVDAHPWTALDLGDGSLVAGRAPTESHEIVLPGALADELGVSVGDVVEAAFGGRGADRTVVGLTSADHRGVDVPDVHIDAAALPRPDDGGRTVAVVGVWPADAAERAAVEEVAGRHDATAWTVSDRGRVEVVAQGRARGTLTSAAGAFGSLAVIVTVFATVALTSLQIRERSRELALLRVVGATPRQVKGLLRREARRVALISGVAGGIVGAAAGALIIAVIRTGGVVPDTLDPVVSPLAVLLPATVGLLAAEVAVRISQRRVVRGSPLTSLDGSDQAPSRSAGGRVRPVLGTAVLVLGAAMAAAPWYLTGEAATGLPGLSGLVVALSAGPLAPVVVRRAERLVRRRADGTAVGHIALASIRLRAARVGGVLAPIVLGVTLTTTQLSSGATFAAVAQDQAVTGARADLVIRSSGAGIGPDTVAAVEAVPGVDAVIPVVTASVAVRGPAHDSSWQVLPAFGTPSDRLARYADLDPQPGGRLPLGDGEVSLGVQGAGLLHAGRGDTVRLVLPDGDAVERRVAAIHRRGLGLGEVVLPIDDLQQAEASGLPTALALGLAEGVSAEDADDRLQGVLGPRPGLEVARSSTVAPSGPATDGSTFQVILLLVIWGYIAVAVVSSLVVATLARGPELALLRAIGATTAQRRRVLRGEATFLAATASVIGIAAAVPGLAGLTWALSNGERLLPAIDPLATVLVIGFTFALVRGATALAGRRAERTPVR